MEGFPACCLIKIKSGLLAIKILFGKLDLNQCSSTQEGGTPAVPGREGIDASRSRVSAHADEVVIQSQNFRVDQWALASVSSSRGKTRGSPTLSQGLSQPSRSSRAVPS